LTRHRYNATTPERQITWLRSMNVQARIACEEAGAEARLLDAVKVLKG